MGLGIKILQTLKSVSLNSDVAHKASREIKTKIDKNKERDRGERRSRLSGTSETILITLGAVGSSVHGRGHGCLQVYTLQGSFVSRIWKSLDGLGKNSFAFPSWPQWAPQWGRAELRWARSPEPTRAQVRSTKHQCHFLCSSLTLLSAPHTTLTVNPSYLSKTDSCPSQRHPSQTVLTSILSFPLTSYLSLGFPLCFSSIFLWLFAPLPQNGFLMLSQALVVHV